MQALIKPIGVAKSLKKNERACMFFRVMRVHNLHEHVMCIRTTHHSLKNVFANDRNTYRLRPDDQEKKLSTSHFIMNTNAGVISWEIRLQNKDENCQKRENNSTKTNVSIFFSFKEKLVNEILLKTFQTDFFCRKFFLQIKINVRSILEF